MPSTATVTTSSRAAVYVGRQPIFDRNLKVYAYELLYRSGMSGGAAQGRVSGDRATTDTIVNAFLEIGLERLVGTRCGAINLTEDFLLGDNKLPFSPQQIILEILEDVPVSEALIAAVTRLKREGYTIALDDYLFNPAHEPLLRLADIVKIDILALDAQQLEEHVHVLRRFDVKLIAEKVETPQEFIRCRDLGFDLFQGYFLSRPQIVSAERLPSNRLAILNLLAVLNNAEAEPEDLAEAINADVAVSYKLLKVLNSAAINLPRKVESIQQGVVLLGRRKLVSWASMLAVSTMDDRPAELVRTAMIRAKMCELLAEQAGLGPLESYCTVGLFSALDLLMQQPLAKLIQPLPLSGDIVAGLLHREGKLGAALDCAIAYETGDWEKIRFDKLTADDILVANIEAVTWANALLDSL